MRLWIPILAVLCSGCLTIETRVGADADGNPSMTQTVSGRAGAAVKAAKQSLDGKITVDPDTGILTVDIVSGQDAEGASSDMEAVMSGLKMLGALTTP